MAKKKSKKKKLVQRKPPRVSKKMGRLPVETAKTLVEEALFPVVSLETYDWKKLLLTPHRRRLPFELWLLVQVVFFGSILTFFYAFREQPWVAAVISVGMILIWIVAWSLTWFAQTHWWSEDS